MSSPNKDSWKKTRENLPEISSAGLFDVVSEDIAEVGGKYGAGQRSRDYAWNMVNILARHKEPMRLGEIREKMVRKNVLTVKETSRNKILHRALIPLEIKGTVKRWPVVEDGEYKRKDYYLAYRVTEYCSEGAEAEDFAEMVLKIANDLDSIKEKMGKMEEDVGKISEVLKIVTTVEKQVEKVQKSRIF